MIRLTMSISLGEFSFPFVSSCEIESSWQELTDVATLTIPKKLRYRKDGKTITNVIGGTDSLIRRGDPVTIRAGYNDTNDVLFQGYISGARPKLPIEIECQDEMYTLKQVTVDKFSQRNVTLDTLLSEILPAGISYRAAEVNLGTFRISRATVAEVLEHINSNYGLSAYFVDGVLVVGFAYESEERTGLPIREFMFEKNIIDDTDLEYTRSDDVKLRVKAISINGSNEKIEVNVGDSEGEQRTLYYYNLTESELTKIANEQFGKLKYEGYRGSFITFLQPTVKHGQVVKMVNEKLPEKDGFYLVKRVVRTFGFEGGRQEITLERKV